MTAVGFEIMMVPRGEVLLIVASIGKSMGIINVQFYAVTVMVILATVLITPVALKLVFSKEVSGRSEKIA